MTADQTAINNRIVIAAAARLETSGFTGDAYRFCESLLMNALADGYRALPRPVPVRGPGARRESIDAALRATRAAIDQARDARRHPAATPREDSK